jgi:hypothetical protein
MNHRYLALIFAAMLTPVSVWAQSQSLPRTPDGKPDLGGYWNLPEALRFNGNLAQGKEDQVPYTPVGREAFLHRDAADDPTAYCLPPGMPRMLHSPFPMLIMQTPGLVAQLFEYQKIWRLIYTDGRPHHADNTDTFMGDSIGHWEGNTLVVDTVGINDRSWLDTEGHQHTSDIHLIERITRTALDTLHYEVTVIDPKYYSKPWTHAGDMHPIKATKGLPELLEYFCNDNEQDSKNFVETKDHLPEQK